MVTIGDRVLVRIKETLIQPAKSDDYSKLLQFDVIGERNDLYIIYIPSNITIDESFELSSFDCNRYDVSMRFLNDRAYIIGESHIVKTFSKLGPREGESCVRCQEFSSYAEPNQENGSFK